MARLLRSSRVQRSLLLLVAVCVSIALIAVLTPSQPAIAVTAVVALWLAYALFRVCEVYGLTLRGRKRAESPAVPEASHRGADPETGLPGRAQLAAMLQHEIARSKRYGDKSALVVFDTRVVNFRPEEGDERMPSPGAHIAEVFEERGRESDLVSRLDLTRFAVFLTDATDDGAAQFAERTRTALGAKPFARNQDGSGVWIRAWAGWVTWQPAYERPAQYLSAALERLEEERKASVAEEAAYGSDEQRAS